MDGLPELPFEKMLSYMSLAYRLKARAVSRSWYQRINSYKVKTLCYSARPKCIIWGKNRWIRDVFAQNHVCSTEFALFFDTFGRSILSNLKRLRFCDLDLNEVNVAAFATTINSLVQLEDLALYYLNIYFNMRSHSFVVRSSNSGVEFELNLPMLRSLKLDKVNGIKKLTVNAPKLRNVKIWHCELNLVIVHGESVKCLLADSLLYTEVKNLKNLVVLYTVPYLEIDSTLLSYLKKLKQVCLTDPEDIESLFEQKRRYARTELRIYFRGLLLNGPDDPAIHSLSPGFNQQALSQLAENQPRLADEFPFHCTLEYSPIERVAPAAAIDLLRRFTGLEVINVDRPVQDVERFLALLKQFYNVGELEFECAQPQELFDRLPEYCAIQGLDMQSAPADLSFLSRLKNLIRIDLAFSIEPELVRELFEALPSLIWLQFKFNNEPAEIGISGCTKQYQVVLKPDLECTDMPDLETAIRFIFETAPRERGQRKRFKSSHNL